LFARLQDRSYHRRNWNGMSPAVLHAMWWKLNDAFLKIDFIPMQIRDLALTRAGQNQYFQDVTEVTRREGVPQYAQFTIAENSIAWLFRIFVGRQCWIAVDQPFAHGPIQEAGQRASCSIGLNWRAGHTGELRCNSATVHLVNRQRVQRG